MTKALDATLSGYRVMWVWVIFDLPVLTRAERKRAAKFRNDLLDLGFGMVQYSVYLRHAWSREKAEFYAMQVGDCVPEAGHVQVLFFTDRQYAQSHVYHGKRRPQRPAGKPEQLVLF